nr:hypothetical protein [uncultured Holophaga sp.]
MKALAFGLSTLNLMIVLACGGGGNSTQSTSTDTTTTVSTATGIFSDAPVEGLTYVSGSQSGTTAASGSFTYEVGNTVTFSLGGITLPNVAGSSLITPYTIFGATSLTDTASVNLARLLQTLDDDSDGTITIPTAVKTAAASLSLTADDFASSSFDSKVATLVSAAGASSLVDASTAETHMLSTALAGTWYSAAMATPATDGSGAFGYGFGSFTVEDGSTSFSDGTRIAGNITMAEADGFSVDSDGNLEASAGYWVMNQSQSAMALFLPPPYGHNLVILPKQGSSYSTGDLEGTWKGVSFMSPSQGTNNADSYGWNIHQIGITSTGSMTYNVTAGTDGAFSGSGTMTLDSSTGMVSTEESAEYWYLGASKDLLVAVWDEDSTQEIQVNLKQADTYSLSDLAGTWRMMGLKTGLLDTDASHQGYHVLTMVVGSDGSATVSDEASSTGTYTSTAAFQLVSGAFSVVGDTSESYWYMNAGKDVLVKLYIDSDNSEKKICIYLKR